MRSLSDELRKRLPDVQLLIGLAQQFISQAQKIATEEPKGDDVAADAAADGGDVAAGLSAAAGDVATSAPWSHMVLSLVLSYQTYVQPLFFFFAFSYLL